MSENAKTALVRQEDRQVAKSTTGASAAEASVGGAQKAALWLLSADEELAVQTMSLLDVEEVRRLKQVAEKLGRVSPEQLAGVHQDFLRAANESPLRVRGSVQYLNRLATRAFGEGKASALFSATPSESPPPGSQLRRADVESLSTALAGEHPQVIAAVLAAVDPPCAAGLLKRLPAEEKKHVLERVAALTHLPSTGIADVERVLGASLRVADDDDHGIDGVRTAAVLLNQLPPSDAEEILNAFTDGGEGTAEAIRRAMFAFEDLVRLDRRGWQMVLKEVQREQLLPALKTASPEIRQQVFGSLSRRAAEMLKDDLEVLGPVRVADVEAARLAIVDVALRLRAEGRLNIAGIGGDEFA